MLIARWSVQPLPRCRALRRCRHWKPAGPGRAGLQATARSHAGAGYRASVNAYCTGRVLDAGAHAAARPLVLPHCIQHCWLARGSRAGCGRRQLLVVRWTRLLYRFPRNVVVQFGHHASLRLVSV